MKRGACTILAVLLAASLAACERDIIGGEDPPATPGQESPATPPIAGEATPAAPPAPPPGGILASREIQDDGATLRIDITGLHRQGETAILTWRITVVDGGELDRWHVGSSMGTDTRDFTVSGVVLIDPVNAQRYLVARSGGADGPCACTDNTDFVMDGGDSSEFHATYAAPPAEVTTLNVEFPRFGAFTDVLVS